MLRGIQAREVDPFKILKREMGVLLREGGARTSFTATRAMGLAHEAF